MKKYITIILAAILTCAMIVPAFAEEAEQIEMAAGSIDGQVYTNEALNLTYEAPEGWILCDHDQIALVTGISAEIFSDSEAFQQFMEDAGSFTDMLAMNGNDSVNIAIQLLKDEEKRSFSLFTLAQVAENMESEVVTMLESAGYQDVVFTVDESYDEFPADNYTCIRIDAVVNGNPMYMQEVLCLIDDEYLATVTAGSYQENRTDEYLQEFSRIVDTVEE